MDKDLRILRTFWKYARVLIGLPVVWASWKAGMLAYTAGLLPHEAVLMGLWALLLATCSAWVILFLVDRMIGGIERFREGRRTAKLLDEWRIVGNRTINIGSLADLWAGKRPETKTERLLKENTLLRNLKYAVKQGLIELASPRSDGEINVHTICDTKSAADFFRKRKWLDVKEEEQNPPVVSDVPKPLFIGKRKNWVMDWKDEDPWM